MGFRGGVMKKILWCLMALPFFLSEAVQHLYILNCSLGSEIHVCVDTFMCKPFDKNLVRYGNAIFMPYTLNGRDFDNIVQGLINGDIPQLFVVVESIASKCVYRLEFDQAGQKLQLKQGRVFDILASEISYSADQDAYTLIVHPNCRLELKFGLPGSCPVVQRPA